MSRIPLGVRRAWPVVECGAILVWASIIARPVLKFGNHVVPAGGDFFNVVQGNYFWENVKACGRCAFWNGALRGGSPALADPQSATLHPVTIATTLAFGVIDGAKVAILVTLVLAGIGQLWLGYELGVGKPARLAMALTAVGSGHVIGPLEGGVLAVSLAVASASFLIAAIVHYANTMTERAVGLVGLFLAMVLVSGQGYIQTAMLLLLPLAAMLFVGRERFSWAKGATDAVVAAAIGVLLASPFLVPFFHILPDFEKDTEPQFRAGQSLGNTALNLVINDWEFARNESLGKSSFPFTSLNHVGWFAVLLAFLGVVRLWDRDRRMCGYLASMTVGGLWLATGQPFRLVYEHVEFLPLAQESAAGFRSVSIISGVAVIPLLGLAAVGFDALFFWRPTADRLSIAFSHSDGRRRELRPDLRPVLFFLTVLSLSNTLEFSRHWVRAESPDIASIEETLEALATDDLQWVQPLQGETWFLAYTSEYGLKVSDQWRPWWLFDRTLPEPLLLSERGGEVPAHSEIVSQYDGVTVYRRLDVPEYVSFSGEVGSSPCSASGRGGDIDVRCALPGAGDVIILETWVPGWKATVNGAPQTVQESGRWLAVEAPSGDVSIEVRYRPWDVWVGLTMFLVGAIWVALRVTRFRWLSVPPFGRGKQNVVSGHVGEADFVPY